MPLRPKRISTRPVDEPASTSPTGMDFERRRLYIAPSSIVGYMISPRFKGIIAGVYGTSKYGRCRYTSRPGIYGYDKYGGCTYI